MRGSARSAPESVRNPNQGGRPRFHGRSGVVQQYPECFCRNDVMDLSEKVSSRMGAGSLGGEALWRYQMDGRNEAV